MPKGEDTRKFIIERSAPIFNTKGLAATSMSDIMEATKLSKGSLYVHFEDKDVLSHAAVDYNLEKLMEKVQAALSKEKTAKGKLLAYIDLFIDPMNPPVTGGCPMINFGMEADDTSPVVKEKVKGGVDTAQKTIAGIIKAGIKAGEFKSSWDYEEFATSMFAMIEGGIVICRVNGNNKKLKVIAGAIKKMIEAEVQ